MLLAVPVWFFIFALVYASCYFEGGARGAAALAPSSFLYTCMAPVPALMLSGAFLAQSGQWVLLEGEVRVAATGLAAEPSPKGEAEAAGERAAPSVASSPSPCAFGRWLRSTPPPVALAAPGMLLACAAAYELLLFCLAAHRFSELSSRFSVAASASPPTPAFSSRWRHRMGEALSDLLLRAVALIAHLLAVAADIPCAILFLLPDISLLAETYGFAREARVFRFSLRAAMVAVLVTLTMEAACWANSGSGADVGHSPSPPPPPLVALYLCATWTWRAGVAVSDCLGMMGRSAVRGRLGF
jgi:hypothetical protein